MTKTELEQWAMDEFWPLYKELTKTPFATQWKATDRGAAVSKILSLNPSGELRQRIVASVQAQIKHRRDFFKHCGSMEVYNQKTHRIKFYCNRMGASWLNQRGWDDEIPTIEQAVEDETIHFTICTEKGCTFPVHGARYDKCIDHLAREKDGPMMDELRQYYRDHDLGSKTREEMVALIKHSAKAIGK